MRLRRNSYLGGAIDATEFNHGKFLVGRWTDEEWATRGQIDARHPLLLPSIGHNRRDVLVLDLQTCEGAIFTPGGVASSDLNKHKVWVCPMYEPFLAWLYRQDLTDLAALPSMVNLGDVPTSMHGYRRSGRSIHTRRRSIHTGRGRSHARRSRLPAVTFRLRVGCNKLSHFPLASTNPLD